ncbi:phosphopantetheine-binding protein [Saccharothrix sp. S26]|uniref:phosphopantetheine-binding protein n=1 Tax=Saccharothrix sp. S26 TaxID=2907215 RepID=UPI001F42AEFE|nr:phosphopantetheine-binding protein [Saccharothrix sp. S26]MCE6996441.1 phosphopantetheine-binding protein [Saccharothrix sp. S26]
MAEIAAVLSAHPGVGRAEVAVVPHDGRDVTVAAVELMEYLSGPVLRNHVRRQLGEDCGLNGVLVVDRVPLAGGAVDVEELAAAVADGRCALFEDPRDDVERRVAEIWSAQMDVRPVGATDDFLELGGDSLSALGIIAAIEAEFDRPLDVYEFMSASSVRRLAEMLR